MSDRPADIDLRDVTALITGGASGLGAAVSRAVTAAGGHVVLADLNEAAGAALASELGGRARFASCDVTSADDVGRAVELARELPGELRLAVGCAGVGWAQRTVGRQGAAPLDAFEKVVNVNLVGMFNMLRLAAAAMSENTPGPDGERGCVVMTSSIAAFDGQIGQTAYAASKGGVASLTLPAARDMASLGVRVNTIAPGLFDTPLLAALPEAARTALGEGVPFPSRLGRPEEFASLVLSIAGNRMLNGETIRLDGALRMPPR